MNDTKEKKTVSKKTFEELRKRQLRRRKIVITTLSATALALVLVLLYCFGVYEKFLEAIGIEPDISVDAVVSEISYAPRGEYIVGAVQDCMIICDENGVTGLDEQGTWKWNVSCPLTNPVMQCYKDFVLLSDFEGKNLWCFDKNGQRFRHDSEEPIVGAFASQTGDGLALLCSQAEFETAVTYYTCKDGVLTQVFTRKFGTYHMFTGDRSADKEAIVLSGVYASGGELTGAMVFVRIRDGEVFSTVVTEGQAYPLVTYLNKDVVFAANTDSLRLIKRVGTASSGNDTEKVLWSRDGGRTSIADMVCVAGKHCVVAYQKDNLDEAGSGNSSLVYYNSVGKVIREIEIKGRLQSVSAQGKTVVAYTDRGIHMFNEKGNRIGSYTFESNIKSVSYIGNREIVVVCLEGIWHVSFEE